MASTKGHASCASDLPLRANDLDAIVITHAHIDHCGHLPRLVAQGFDGPVYATPSTIELARIVLPDSGHLNEEDAEYANRKGFSRHHPAKPLYTEDDAVHAGEQFRTLDHAAEIHIAPDVRVRLARGPHPRRRQRRAPARARRTDRRRQRRHRTAEPPAARPTRSSTSS